MDLIGNAFVVAGIILTLLVGAVAWVVTRQVVTPVRRAGEVAQRLSAGKLNERMPARGEDDLALLATSFNGMADSLQSQIRQLEGLSAVQQRFVSDVSHELRTPLTTIRMAVDLIHESRDGLRPLGRPVRRAARRRARPVRGRCCPTCSRSAGSTPARPRSTSSRSTCAARSPRSSRRPGPSPSAGAAWSRCTPPTSRPRPRSTSGASSASCATSSSTPSSTARGGRSTSTSRSATDAVAVVVEDHGVGLRPGEAANVFTRFWRADPARARTTGGTGLGLSISLEDARLHNGWLQAWGERGVGLALPPDPAAARRRDPARVAAAAQPDGGPVTGRRRLAAALSVLVALLLAGCGGLSRDGPVEPGLDVGSGNPPDLRVLFPGPGPGAGQESIVRGFVRAGCGQRRGLRQRPRLPHPRRSARSGTPTAPSCCSPTTVPPKATLLDPATVRITARAAGTVDAEGRYTAARPGSTVSATSACRPWAGSGGSASCPRASAGGSPSAERQPARAALRRALRLDQPPRPRARRALVPRRQARDPARPRPARPRARPPRRRGRHRRAGRRPPARGCRVGRVGRRDRQPHLEPARRRGDEPAEPVGAVRQHPDCRTPRCQPGRAVGQRRAGRPRRSSTGSPAGTAGSCRGRLHRPRPSPSLARPVVRRGDDVVVFDPAALGEPEPRQPAGVRQLPAGAAAPSAASRCRPTGRARRRRPRRRRHLPVARDQPLRGAARRHRRRPPLLRPARASSGWVPSGPGGAKAPRLWVVDARPTRPGPGPAPPRSRRRGWTGAGSSRPGWPPDGDRVAVLSTLPDGSDSRIDLAGVVRTGGGRAAAARRRRCGSVRR